MPTNARVNQLVREAFVSSNPNARVNQVVREAFVTNALPPINPPIPPPVTPPCGQPNNGIFLSDLGINVIPATDLYENQLPSNIIAASEFDTEGRTGVVLDFNSGDGLYSRDIGTIFSWSVSNRAVLWVWQPSLIPMPENQFNRPSDWIDGGHPGNKFIQGIIVEADTFNLPKTFQLQSADDLSLHTLNEMPAVFPKQTIKAFSCQTPFLAHSVRIQSTDGVAWRVWGPRVIFQPWPEQVVNWQSEQTSFGMTGWLHAREMNIAYAAVNPITIVLTFDAWPLIQLSLPATGATVQAKTKLTLPPNKFKLCAVQVSSSAPFYLFEGDLEFKVKQWGSTGAFNVLKVVGGPSKTGAIV